MRDPGQRIAALSPEKRALLRLRNPLSFAQSRLWFLDQLDPGSADYNVPGALRISGALSVRALRESLERCIERHEILRTVFPNVDGHPMQVVLPAEPVSLPRIDLRALAATARRQEASKIARREARSSFRLARGPLVRTRILVLGDREHILLLNLHHVICDGWSRDILVHEIAQLYGHPQRALPELPIQYRDYARWQRSWLESERAAGQLTYWREQLEGAPPVLDLPFDRPRSSAGLGTGSRGTRRLAPHLAEQLASLGRELGASTFMIWLAAINVLLYRDTGRSDILIGAPLTNRQQLETEGLVGLFLNLLVLRADLSAAPSLRQVISRVRTTTLEAYDHQDLPFEMLVDELQPQRTLGVHPLFQVLFTLLEEPPAELAMGGLTLSRMEIEDRQAKYDLTFAASTFGGRLDLTAEWSDALFDRPTIERLLARFEHLLTSALAEPDCPVNDLSLLGRSEHWQVTGAWNDSAIEFPERCLHDLLRERAAEVPERIAMTCGERQLTFGELHRRVAQLAGQLRTLGVKPEDIVGLSVERSVEMIVGILGILEAGGAYLPLDPSFPEGRLRYMVEDAGVEVLVHGRGAPRGLLNSCAYQVDLEHDETYLHREVVGASESELTPSQQNAAYVIYTSGSTGKPKGVLITHGSVVSLLTSMLQRPGLSHDDVLLGVTTLSFDIAVVEVFLPLLVGARLVMAESETMSDGVALDRLARRSRATFMQATPATWRMLLDSGWSGSEQLLAVCGGEALVPTLARDLSSRVCSLWNLYGPTEATVWSSLEPVDPTDHPGAIGRAIGNTTLHIVDRRLRLRAIGVSGRLFLGGVGLARGYVGKPGLTAEKFVPDPFGAKGARLYDTGDLGRFLADGRMDLAGRADHQVKVRGFRIEPGEIERVLEQHPAVVAAAVIVRHRAASDAALIAYWVARQGEAARVSDLKSFLRGQLPDYMVPAVFVASRALPLTPNNKVDRRALAALEIVGHQVSAERAEPRGPVEEVLCGIWQSLLEIEPPGIHDDFFELGGHSLLATQLISRIRDVFKVEIPVRNIFETPTVSGLASGIEQALRADVGVSAPPLGPSDRRQNLPLTFAQQRIWFLEQMAPGGAAYHVHKAIRFQGDFDLAALAASLAAVVARHESLRTIFLASDGQPAQEVLPALAPGLAVADLSGLGPTTREAEARRRMIAEALRPFDLTRGPLIRVLMVRLAAREHLAVLTLHHIVSDAWSVAVLVRELIHFYLAYRGHQAPEPLPELPIQYPDFAHWQRRWLRGDVLASEVAYWKERLADAPPVLELATDRQRPAVQRFRGAYETFTLSPELATALHDVSRLEGCTLFMVLLSAYQSLLARYSGQDDVAVGSPIANRNRAEVEGLIGVFVNMLVLRTDLAGEPTFRELLAQVKRLCLEAYAHQDLPFEKLLDELDLERSASHTPLFQTVLALQNVPTVVADLSGLSITGEEIDSGTAKFDLTLVISEEAGSLLGKLTYDRDLFEAVSIRRMIHHLRNLLDGVVAAPQQLVSELPWLAAAETHQLLVERSRAASAGGTGSIAGRFAAQAATRPAAVALAFGDQLVTYGELDRRANALAGRLQARGTGSEQRVAVFLDRSVEMVVAILGILKASGAYVPVDPDAPPDRVRFLLADSQVSCVVTRRGLTSRLPARGLHPICLDSALFAASPEVPVSRVDAAAGDGAAYVIYTSGSTGQPKGVVVSQRNVLRLFDATEESFRFRADDVWTLFHSYAFDFSVWELFGALLFGGRLVVVPYRLSRSPDELLQLLQRERVSVLNQTPSAFYQLVQSVAASHDTWQLALRWIIFGGEALDLTGVAPWWSSFGDARPRLVNMFGITETTVHVTRIPLAAADLAGDSLSPIGREIADLEVFVLDRRFRPVPLNVRGELLVGGAGLARGYLGRAALTAERFVPHPFADRAGARLYRSGDLARLLANGELDYLGRLDDQVKIRGFRIELGEITAALKAHPALSDAAV
ncbi:MAG: amino acid adenylation domain-containing protein, partial [Acidobacteriota bacterium]